MKRETIIGILYIMVFLLAVSLKMRYEKTQDKSTERETIGANDSVSIKLNAKDRNVKIVDVNLYVEEISSGSIQLNKLEKEEAESIRLKMTKNNKSYFMKFKSSGGGWNLITTNNINLNVNDAIHLNNYLGIIDTNLARSVNLKKYKTVVRNISGDFLMPMNRVLSEDGVSFQIFRKEFSLENVEIDKAGVIISLPGSNQSLKDFKAQPITDESHRVDIIANGKLAGGRDLVYMEIYKSTDSRKALDAHYFELARGEGEFYIADVSLELNPPPFIGGPSASILTVANGTIDFTKTKMLNGSSTSKIEKIPGDDKKMRILHDRTFANNTYSLQVASMNGSADTTWSFEGISRGGDAGNPCNWVSIGNVISPITANNVYEDQDVIINAGLEGECGIGKVDYTIQFVPNAVQSVGASSTIEVPFGSTELIVTAKAPNGKTFAERVSVASVLESKNFKISANPFISGSTPYIDVTVRNTVITKNVNFNEYKFVSGTLKLGGIPKTFKASSKGNSLQLILPTGTSNASITSLELTLRNPSGKNITIMY